MRLNDCHNFSDLRHLAKKRLPGPIFNYIDGGADDELTLRKNTASFDQVDLVPNVLNGIEDIDLSTEVMGLKIDLPVYLSPTALQRLFHHEGERAVAAAAHKFNTIFGVSSLGTVSLEELRKKHASPQVYQFYFHKDRGLNKAMLERAKAADIDALMLTVDAITGGNRERDLRTGFSIPLRLNLRSILQFAAKPAWGLNFALREPFRLPQLDEFVEIGGSTMSIGRYFTDMLDPTLTWDDVAELAEQWGGPLCLKGVMSSGDARRAVEMGCKGIVLSNHGGRQLDGSRTAIDQLPEIMDEVGDQIDVMIDGGVQRGTHVLKALCMGAKAVGVGRYYLYALSAGGQKGVEHALHLMQTELIRNMRLLGVRSVKELNSSMLRQ